MQVTAEDDGFQVLAMRDPRIPDGEWAQALTKVASDGLTDIGLIAQTTAADCGLLNHTPSALVGRCGAVHPWPILGVMPSDFWADTLHSRLGQLAGEGCK
ncbi:hypothetical protein FVQ98_14890 [Ottowia sp. GY511]|nr:hypothetical protein [Ottowia sp. GY511]TXK26252.1 hypothetical protein FVQ98_14890 [Ottowia sp. GY511]